MSGVYKEVYLEGNLQDEVEIRRGLDEDGGTAELDGVEPNLEDNRHSQMSGLRALGILPG